MSELEQRRRAEDGDRDGGSADPEHLTRQPLWIVPLCGAVASVLPVLQYGRFQRAVGDVPIWQGMLTAFLLGCGAALPLVLRSHIRSAFWSGFALWFGILVIAVVACFVLVLVD